MLRFSNLSRVGKGFVVLLGILVVVLFVTRSYVLMGNQTEYVSLISYGEQEQGYPLEISMLQSEDLDDTENSEMSTLGVLHAFCKIMQPVKPIIIEPSTLFNSINSTDQELLQQKGFVVREPSENFTVISFALIENGSTIQQKLRSEKDNLSRLFQHWVADWDLKDGDWRPPYLGRSNKLPGHHFFLRGRTLIHAIIFHPRQSYLWHVGLPSSAILPVSRNELTFVNSSAYERFSAVPVHPAKNESYRFYVPSQTTLFLMEIASSRFLECDLSRASNVSKSDLEHNKRYDKLKVTFADSLNQLKTLLYPRLKMFYIFAGTLLGWYRQCDIIPYTSDVDFAAWSSDIGDEQFWIKTFNSEENPVKLGEVMGLPEKGYELSFRLYHEKVDMFFIYRNETMSWAHGHRPSKGYFFTYNYPKFELCSGDLVGFKVLVPCNAEEVIRAEYGPDWKKPVSGWYYESSPRNMGHRQFWTEEEKKRIAKASS